MQDPDDDISSDNTKHDLFDQGVINTKTDGFVDWVIQPAGWLVLIVALISAYEVFMRYVLDAPTTWVHETSTFLIALVFLIGGARAFARNQHVQINLLQYILPVQHRGKLPLINGFLLIIICLALVYVSGIMAWQATHARPGLPFYFERTGTFWNPPFPAWIKVALFGTCCLMTVQSFAQFMRKMSLRHTDQMAPETSAEPSNNSRKER